MPPNKAKPSKTLGGFFTPAACKKSPQHRPASPARRYAVKIGRMDIAQLSRCLENLIKRGEIAEVNPAAGQVRVRIGGLTTDWLDYFVPAAGQVSVHRPPSVGEVCVVLSPSGEPGAGMVLCGLAGKAHPSPSDSAGETVTIYPDGAIVKYNHVSGSLNVSGIKTGTIQAAQSLLIDCPQTTTTGAFTVQGLFTYLAGMAGNAAAGAGGAGTVIKGPINHLGELTNTGRITSNGKTLHSHTHPGDSGGVTGPPQ